MLQFLLTQIGKLKTSVSGLGTDKEKKIAQVSKSMPSESDAIRLDTIEIDGSKVLNAVVTSANNIGCILYKYSTFWYLAFVNVSTMEKATGQYDILITYRTEQE